MANGFVFYESWVETLDGITESMGVEKGYEFVRNIISYGIDGELLTDDVLLKSVILGTIAPNIDRSQTRYSKSVENGAKGGRPKKDLDVEVAKQMLEVKGMTKDKVAKELGITVRTLNSRLRDCETGKNQKKGVFSDSEIDTADTDVYGAQSEKTRKNLKVFSDDENVESEKTGKNQVFSDVEIVLTDADGDGIQSEKTGKNQKKGVFSDEKIAQSEKTYEKVFSDGDSAEPEKTRKNLKVFSDETNFTSEKTRKNLKVFSDETCAQSEKTRKNLEYEQEYDNIVFEAQPQKQGVFSGYAVKSPDGFVF